MKNTIFIVLAALLFGTAAQAQSTADSIAAKYQLQPMPQSLTVEKTFPVLGTYQLNSAATTDGSAPRQVIITLDSSNKGLVWIDGLPEGRLKAYLKQSPATYRIVAQKSGSGRDVPEGTLMFDPATNTLNIALGKAYDAADPAAVFALNTNAAADMASETPVTVKVKSKGSTVKTKSRTHFYTATKMEESNSTSTNSAKQ